MLKEDAEDVVELMLESAKQVLMDENGKIDKTRGGAGGRAKQTRNFLQALRDDSRSEFTKSDLQAIADRIGLPIGGFGDFLERLENDLLKRHNGDNYVYSLLN